MKPHFLAALVAASAGCASGPVLTLGPQAKEDSGCLPARGLVGIRKIAVLPFSKSVERRAETYEAPALAKLPPKPLYRYLLDDGAAATTALEGALIARGAFGVVERRDLDRILAEQRLQATGLVDAREAVELGKLAGADAVLLGMVNHAYAGYHNKTEGGAWVGTYVPRADLSLRLVAVESGQAVWSCQISRSALSYTNRPLVLSTERTLSEPTRYDAVLLGATVEERIAGILRAAARDAVGLMSPP